jgi:predicted sugar kinase
LDQFSCDEELELYQQLLEMADEAQRRVLMLLIACVFEQDELSSGASLKSVAAATSRNNGPRLH